MANIHLHKWQDPPPIRDFATLQWDFRENCNRIGIDYEKYLLSCPLFYGGIDLSTSLIGITQNSGTFSDFGYTSANNLQPLAFSSIVSVSETSIHTIFLDIRIPASFSDSYIIGAYDNDNYLKIDSTRVRIQDNASSNSDMGYASGFSSETDYKLAIKLYADTAPNVNDYELSVNGISQGVIPRNGAPSPRFKVDTIGNGYTSFVGFLGLIRSVQIINDNVDADIIALLHDNSYVQYQPIPKIKIFDLAASQGGLLPIKYNIDEIAKGVGPLNAAQLGGLLVGG